VHREPRRRSSTNWLTHEAHCSRHSWWLAADPVITEAQLSGKEFLSLHTSHSALD
jgi:hypothetical protein